MKNLTQSILTTTLQFHNFERKKYFNLVENLNWLSLILMSEYQFVTEKGKIIFISFHGSLEEKYRTCISGINKLPVLSDNQNLVLIYILH